MINLIHFFIAFSASVVGAISGIGGGIIIKPVLDAFNLFDIGTINFLSGCTVLSMSSASFLKSRGTETRINRKTGGFIAASGVAGGFAGKYLFNILLKNTARPEGVKFLQALILLILAAGVLIFTVNKHRIKPLHIKSSLFSIIIGLTLGLLGAFLGIGGGPVNLLVFYLFFSMDPKSAALTSLLVIFFSQLSGLITTFITCSIPDFRLSVLLAMIAGGISGAYIGSTILFKMSYKNVDRLFMMVLVLIIGVSVKNMMVL